MREVRADLGCEENRKNKGGVITLSSTVRDEELEAIGSSRGLHCSAGNGGYESLYFCDVVISIFNMTCGKCVKT